MGYQNHNKTLSIRVDGRGLNLNGKGGGRESLRYSKIGIPPKIR